MKYIKTLEKMQEDQVYIVKSICDQEWAKREAVAKWQEAFKAPQILPDKNKN